MPTLNKNLNQMGRNLLRTICITTIAALLFTASPMLADETVDEKIKVLIVDGQNNHGDWPKITAMLKQYLEANGKFTVDVERSKFTWRGDKWLKDFSLKDKEYKALNKAKTDPDFKPTFSDYDVVVSNFGYGAADWPAETEAAFTKFVKEGGGLVSVHSADNSFPNWKEYNEMTGLGGWGGRNENSGPYVYYNDKGEIVRDDSKGKGGNHGPQHEFPVVMRDTEHPITKGLPKEFMHAKDELYEQLRGPAVNMNILATAFASPAKKGSGRHEPTLMTIEFGEGRIFHSTLGHATYSCECVGFITTFLRGTEWAATGKVTIPVPDDFPTANKASSKPFKLAPATEKTSQAKPAGDWGNLSGQIVVTGKVPPQLPEKVGNNPDKAACLVDGKVPLDDGIVVGQNQELRDVFVMMYTGRGADVPDKFHPSYNEDKVVSITLDNVKCRFVPKAVFARAGQKLTLKNSDAVGHNCHGTTFQQEFNVNIPAKKEVEITLEKLSDKVPGPLKCDIHPWMDGSILVRDNPYVAITDANGKFNIQNLPPGEWEFQFWHAKAGYLKKLEVKGYDTSRKGLVKMSIKKGETLDLGNLQLPAESFSK